MNKFILILSLLFSFSSFGETDIKLTRDEFLKKLIDSQITMKKDPLFPISEGSRAKVMEEFKKRHPSFKDAFWFVPNLRTNNYVYTVFFEWPTRRCIFRVEEIDRQTKEIKKESIDPKGQDVDIKYCEKAYGIKIN